jgi:phosphoglycerate dehydrogenase-like enzyme
MADGSPLPARTTVVVLTDHSSNDDALVDRLASFDVICIMRERTTLIRRLIARLPKPKLLASAEPLNAAIDVNAAEEWGTRIVHMGYSSTSTIELNWALTFAGQRHLPGEAASLRSGGWQHGSMAAWQRTVGGDLYGRTLGRLGPGNIGSEVAEVGPAFRMRVLGWSKN